MNSEFTSIEQGTVKVTVPCEFGNVEVGRIHSKGWIVSPSAVLATCSSENAQKISLERLGQEGQE